DLGRSGGAVTQAGCGRRLHGTHHLRMRVTDDHRPPRADVVDVTAALRIGEPGAVCAANERRRATDRAKRAHRRVHAARDDALRTREELIVAHDSTLYKLANRRAVAATSSLSNSAETTASASTPPA